MEKTQISIYTEMDIFKQENSTLIKNYKTNDLFCMTIEEILYDVSINGYLMSKSGNIQNVKNRFTELLNIAKFNCKDVMLFALPNNISDEVDLNLNEMFSRYAKSILRKESDCYSASIGFHKS